MKRRIKSIEFFRFAFACCIAAWHLFAIEKLRHGYLPVEFFFFLSGAWLCDSYLKKNIHYTALQYTVDKVKRVYPEYLISCTIFFAVSFDQFQSMSDWMRTIPELLLLNHTGVFQQGLNYPLWYLSVLLIGGYFVYALLEHYGVVAIRLFLPVVSIGLYTYIFTQGNSIENWSTVGPFYIPLMRGIAGLSLGAFLRSFAAWVEETKRQGIECLINFFSVLSIFGVAICILTEEYFDKYCLIFFSGIIVACLLKHSWLNKIIKGAIWEKLGEYTLEMFMIHASVVSIWKRIPWKPFGTIEKSIYLFTYLVIVFFSAVGLKQVSKALRKGVRKCMGTATR